MLSQTRGRWRPEARSPSERAREDDLDRVRLGGPARRQPRPPGPAENQRSRLLADEREPSLALDGAVPDLEPELALELGGRATADRRRGRPPRRRPARPARTRRWRRSHRCPRCAISSTMLPAGIVEVDRLASQFVKSNTTSPVSESGRSSTRSRGPRERRVKAVARDEQREVVERRARRRARARAPSPRPERPPVPASGCSAAVRAGRRRTRRAPAAARPGPRGGRCERRSASRHPPRFNHPSRAEPDEADPALPRRRPASALRRARAAPAPRSRPSRGRRRGSRPTRASAPDRDPRRESREPPLGDVELHRRPERVPEERGTSNSGSPSIALASIARYGRRRGGCCGGGGRRAPASPGRPRARRRARARAGSGRALPDPSAPPGRASAGRGPRSSGTAPPQDARAACRPRPRSRSPRPRGAPRCRCRPGALDQQRPPLRSRRSSRTAPSPSQSSSASASSSDSSSSGGVTFSTASVAGRCHVRVAGQRERRPELDAPLARRPPPRSARAARDRQGSSASTITARIAP